MKVIDLEGIGITVSKIMLLRLTAKRHPPIWPPRSGRTSPPRKGTLHMRATPLNALPLVLAALLATGIPASAEDGVSADKIVFGQATALDGPASALGQGMKLGIEAAFAEINKAGGVKGRKLELKSIDDGYEPTRSIEAVKKLLEEDRVFALAGTGGPPTPAARARCRCSFYRRLHGCRVPARASQAAGDEYSRQLLPGNRSHGRTSDQGSRRNQNCDHVPGRCLRSGRPCRCQEGARQAADAARRRRHLRAQHSGGQDS